MDPNEQVMEDTIQAKGLNAPRLNPGMIDAAIVGKTFTKLPSGKKMICELTLKNGFTVIGEASVVDPANFDQQIGEAISFKNARENIWQLEGYLLQERLYQQSQEIISADSFGSGSASIPADRVNAGLVRAEQFVKADQEFTSGLQTQHHGGVGGLVRFSPDGTQTETGIQPDPHFVQTRTDIPYDPGTKG